MNILYHGRGGAARAFAEKMESTGILSAIRAEEGNEAYDYYLPFDDPETLLLIDRWRDQEALDAHHASPMMARVAELRERYDLHMEVRRYVDATPAEADERFIRT